MTDYQVVSFSKTRSTYVLEVGLQRPDGGWDDVHDYAFCMMDDRWFHGTGPRRSRMRMEHVMELQRQIIEPALQQRAAAAARRTGGR